MSLANTPVSELMIRAAERHVLVPAFNVAHLPMVEPICTTLADLRTFGLAEVSRIDLMKFGAGSLEAVAEECREHADSAFTRLHLDHTPVIDEDGQTVDWQPIVAEALELGYDSVMIDGSRLPLEENIVATRHVAEMAHARDVPVEAELGAVLGHEEGPLPPYEELFESGRGFTDPDEARRFVADTGCDWLSVAIGNVHGAVSDAARDDKKVEAKLNVEHLRRLREVTGVPLVLHGGSGIRPEYLRRAVRNGIAKINVGTEIRQAYERELVASANVLKAKEAVSASITQLICEVYQIEGSADRLAD
jgi:ketose-bisphosphate aldolase